MPKQKKQKTEKKSSSVNKGKKQVGKKTEKNKKSKVEEGEIIEEKIKKTFQDSKQMEGTCTRFAGSCFAILFMAIFMYLLNTQWDRVGFLTDEFSKWLPFANVSIGLSIVTHIFLMFFGNKVVRSGLQIPSDMMNIVSSTALLLIYPFDITSGTWNTLFKIFLCFALFASIIGVIVRIAKIVLASVKGVEKC